MWRTWPENPWVSPADPASWLCADNALFIMVSSSWWPLYRTCLVAAFSRGILPVRGRGSVASSWIRNALYNIESCDHKGWWGNAHIDGSDGHGVAVGW